MITFNPEQQLRILARDVLPLLEAVVDGFPYNSRFHDYSKESDENNINVRMTLGDYRRVLRLKAELEKL